MTSSFPLIFLAISLAYCVNATKEVLRPRGVPFSKKSFYDPGKDFQCLDGSATIPFLLVNDDYCDCDDGSDEPGTNACPNGLFHCSNIGYVEMIIPSSRVNDGICDCCDASDEYNSSTKCENNCLALGEQMRAEREKYLELLKAGNEIRQQYIEQAKQKIEETKAELESLKPNLVDAEEFKNARLEVKNRAEELEKEALDKHRAEEDRLRKIRDEEELARTKEAASRVFKDLDSNQDGTLTFEELKRTLKFDRDHDGSVSDEEAKYFLNGADQVDLEGFIPTAYSLVMSALQNSEETNAQPDTNPDASDEPLEPAYEAEDEQPNTEEELEEELDATPPPFPGTTSAPETSLEYDELTSQLIEEAKKARDEYNEADSKYLDIQTKIRELEVLLETDFGPNGEFMPLRDQCFELKENEYIYKLCPFNSASQRPESGGTETNLGRWGRWTGPETNHYTNFLMDGGVQCWNGPARSVLVSLSCGSENQLQSASEPNRCEYAFEFKTPAACVLSSSVPDQGHSDHSHTEL